jgi:hypothetical protein
MNDDGLQTGSTPSSTRRMMKWLAVLAIALSVAGVALHWNRGPNLDPRLIGEWRSENGTIRRLHADGRVDELDPAGRPRFALRPLVWRTEASVLVISGRPSPVHQRAKTWFQNLISPVTGVGVIGLSGTRYEVVELTETTLVLRRIRPAGAPPLAAETYRRTEAARE